MANPSRSQAGTRCIARGRPPKVDEAVADLIRTTYQIAKSLRKTAAKCGVNERTVRRVLSGQYPNANGKATDSDGAANPKGSKVIAYRCKPCGHLVEIRPCPICIAKRYEEAQRTLRRLCEVLAKVKHLHLQRF